MAARTLGTMINRITRETRRSGLTADIRDAIEDAIETYKPDRFWFNEKEATAQTTTGVSVYALPNDFIEADELVLVDDSQTRYQMNRVHYETLNALETDTNGFPSDWTIYRDQLILWPPSDRAIEMRFSYLADINRNGISASASSGVSNAWVDEAENLIRLQAKANLYNNRINNPARADRFQVLAQREWNRLQGQTVQKISTGGVKKTQY